MLQTNPVEAAPARPATSLERSILLAVVYGDLFDQPLTEEEIARYRPVVTGADANGSFREALDALLERQLSWVDGLICWRGREGLAELRRRRQAQAPRRWRVAQRYAGWLRHVPFVRMVAVCGSQAMENAGDDGDVDIFLIAAPDRLWIVHFFAMFLRRVAGRDGVKVCPNYFLTLDSLAVEPHSLFMAREIAQTVPLWGEAAYDAFLAANTWVREYLPHLDLRDRRRRLRRPPPSPVQRAFEWLLPGIVGGAADRFLHTVLTGYFSLRWRRYGWGGRELRRAYRRDRQAVIAGGYGPSVAEAFRRRARGRLAAEDLEADLDLLFPARMKTPPAADGPFRELFARHYGGGDG